MRLLWVFVVNSVLVCSVASLAQCAERGDVPYISEVMLLCKRGAHAFLPWLCFGAFTVLVLDELVWMERVACGWTTFCASYCFLNLERFEDRVMSMGSESRGAVGAGHGRRGWRLLFVGFAAAAIAGFALVVHFDWRDVSGAEKAAHKAGVVLLAFGGFGALQVVWATLRTGDSVARLQSSGSAAVMPHDVPWLSWVEIDVVFVLVLGVFMVTTVVGGHTTVSAVFEYIAFAMMLGQTTWLYVLCWERARWMRTWTESEADEGANGANDALGSGKTGARLLWGLLAAYCVEVVVVLLVVL